MRGLCRALTITLALAALCVESGAKKGKKVRKASAAKRAAASADWEKAGADTAPPGSAPAGPALPTAEGWAHGDTTTPVQEIYQTVRTPSRELAAPQWLSLVSSLYPVRQTRVAVRTVRTCYSLRLDFSR